MPPTGGFGGNTGVGDAHNLAWKLTMVLRGEAGAGLLDSYDEERQPVAELIVEQAYTRYVQRVDPSLPQDRLAPPLDDAPIELGPICRSGAVLAAGGDDDAPLDDPRAPSAASGTRIPHVWLENEETVRSTLDLAGPGFTLLADDSRWPEAGTASGIAVRRLGSDARKALRIGTGEALLLRPDGVIGWRSGRATGKAANLLDRALRRLACR